jgi:Tol biopolymer transport system component
MHRTMRQSIALVGALTVLGSGCAWLGRAGHPAASDPFGATGPVATSSDGRYVAYASHTDTASPNALDGVWRWDTVTNTRTLVSVGVGGTDADGGSGEPAMSADGRYVAFSSDATNLVTDDGNDATDIFVRDLVINKTERISLAAGGVEVSDNSSTPTISDDGRYVAFISDSDDLSSLDNNLSSDAYVSDRSTKTVKLASIAGGVQPDFGISEAALSGDGKHLVFTSDSDFLAGDENNSDDVFLKNLSTGSLSWVSRPRTADPSAGGGNQPSVSFDAQYVAFVGGNDIDNGLDPNPGSDVFVRDTVNRTTVRASVTAGGQYVSGTSFGPALSSDGSRVAFASTANVSGNDTNGTKADVFVKDLATGRVALVSTGMFLGQQNADSSQPTITRDGRYAAFISAGKLADDDTNGLRDVYLRAIDVPTVTSISPTTATKGSSVTVTLNGTRFLAGTTVVPMGGVFTPTAITPVSGTQLKVTLSVDANAPSGPQTIYVQVPGTGPGSGTGGVGRCENCLTIP